MKTTDNDIKVLADLKRNLSPDVDITIPKSLAEDICRYCEDRGISISDDLQDYGDFYYRLKKKIEQQEQLSTMFA